MSYEKQTWVTGETITAEKLNHIEGGVEEAQSRNFPIYDNNGTASCTWQELVSAIEDGKNVYLAYSSGGGPDSGIYQMIPLESYKRARQGQEEVPTGSITDGTMVFHARLQIGGSSQEFQDIAYNLNPPDMSLTKIN